MKDLILTGFLSLFLLSSAFPEKLRSALMAEIKSISTQSMRHSDQIRLNFDDFIDIDYKIDESDRSCIISLPNVPYASAVSSKLTRVLKDSSRNITFVVLTKLINETTGEEGSRLKIVFTNTNIHVHVQTLEHPHQLIIDIISNNLLLNNLSGNGVIAQAFNGAVSAHYAAQTLV